MSGSMSISVEQVEAIVRAAGGAAVVALYSGSGDVGELKIVASGAAVGPVNSQFEAFGSGNVIGPCRPSNGWPSSLRRAAGSAMAW